MMKDYTVARIKGLSLLCWTIKFDLILTLSVCIFHFVVLVRELVLCKLYIESEEKWGKSLGGVRNGD